MPRRCLRRVDVYKRQVSEFGWVASLIFLRILQATLAGADERAFRCRRAWLAPAFGVPLLAFYCIFGDILSNLIWCGDVYKRQGFGHHPKDRPAGGKGL